MSSSSPATPVDEETGGFDLKMEENEIDVSFYFSTVLLEGFIFIYLP